jgi:hypothetical protein
MKKFIWIIGLLFMTGLVSAYPTNYCIMLSGGLWCTNTTLSTNNSYTIAQTDALLLGKLSLTDQRFNDTAAINFVNASLSNFYLNSNPQGFINASQLIQFNQSQDISYLNFTINGLMVSNVSLWGNFANYYPASNPSGFVDASGLQAFNDTAGIRSLNMSKLNVSDQRFNDTAGINFVNASLSNFYTLINGNGLASNITNLQASNISIWSNFANYYSLIRGNDLALNVSNLQVSNLSKLQNGSSANLSSLIVVGNTTLYNLNSTGNITFLDNSGQSRDLGNIATHISEMQLNTLLDNSRSSINLTSNGLNFTLYAVNGCGQWNLGGIIYPNDHSCVTSATITLLNGTDANPKTNYLHFYLNAGIPTFTSTESYPSYEHIDVATFKVGNVNATNFTIYSYDRNRYEIYSFISNVIERFEEAGTLYVSGFSTIAGTKNILVGPGNFFNGITEMFTNLSINSSNSFYRINSTGQFITAATFNSSSFSQYQTGQLVSNNRYINVVWGIVPTSPVSGGSVATIPKLVAIIQSRPSTEYTSTALAEQDLFGMTNYYPSDSTIKNVFTPIARQVLLIQTGGGGTATAQTLTNGALFIDIRGKTSSTGGAPMPSSSDHAVLSNLDYSVAGHTGFASSSDINLLNLSKLNISDQRFNDSASIDLLNLSKLNISDQRFNDSLAISYINSSLINYYLAINGNSLAINISNTNQSLMDYILAQGLINDDLYRIKLNVTDQRFNESAGIVSLNATKLNIGADINWTQLQNYPIACSANNFMTQVGDSITCTSVQETVVSLKVNGNLTVTDRVIVSKPIPFYIWYFNDTVWDCVNATGTIYNRGNASILCA